MFFYLEPHESILSDINNELINTYVALRDDVESVYRNLRIHERNHCREYFYQVRDIYKCAATKGFKNCGECKELPCQDLITFIGNGHNPDRLSNLNKWKEEE